jgi:hypothetical protein
MARVPDIEMLLRHVPLDGSAIGNITLREILGWDANKYFRVRQNLLDDGVLQVGGGRGGSVSRVPTVSPKGAASTKKLPSNPMSVIPIFPLEALTLSDIDTAIEETPEYGATDFRQLVCNTIGAIHQIPILFYRKTGIEYQLKQIDAYFGRSSSGSQALGANLWQRLRAGAEQREHDYGMIFAKTSIAASLGYERHGIRLLEVLHKMDGLCISNNSFSAIGRVGSVEPGYLYMTFRMLDYEPRPARELTKEQIRRLVQEYRAELHSEGGRGRERSLDAVLNGFEIGLSTANDVNAHGAYKPKLIDYSNYA